MCRVCGIQRQSSPNLQMNEMLGFYISFLPNSYKSPLQMAELFLNGTAFSNLNAILSHTKDHFPATGRLVYNMIKAAILELNNKIKFQKHHPENKLCQMKFLLFSAFQYLYKAWQVQDEMKKQKMAKEAQLYKTARHADELLDEEKREKELKEMFPLYEEVWGSDSESEEDYMHEDGTGGMTERMASELAAKDNKHKEDSDEDASDKKNQPQDTPYDELDYEYEGEQPDPMINASPSKVYEGERPMTKDSHILGSFDLTIIPPAPRGVPQIGVKFESDVNGILKVTAEDKGAGNKEKITITNDHNRVTPGDMERMIKDAEQFAEDDKKIKEKVEARNELESYEYTLKSQLSDKEKMGGTLSYCDKGKFDEALEKKRKWLKSNPDADAEELKSQKKEVEGNSCS